MKNDEIKTGLEEFFAAVTELKHKHQIENILVAVDASQVAEKIQLKVPPKTMTLINGRTISLVYMIAPILIILLKNKPKIYKKILLDQLTKTVLSEECFTTIALSGERSGDHE